MEQDLVATIPSSSPEEFSDATAQRLLELGAFYGRTKRRTNPKMKEFVFTTRGEIEIIDVRCIASAMEKAKQFVEEKAKSGAVFLLVATQPIAADAAKEFAAAVQCPFVQKRWIGGTLTNFKTISARVAHYISLKEGFSSGAMEKYTKKERLYKEREMKKLGEILGGLESLHTLPDVVIVVDAVMHHIAVREANRQGIPVVAFSNTDANPDFIDYLVPGNSSSKQSVTWFLEELRDAILRGRKSAPPVEHQDKNTPTATNNDKTPQQEASTEIKI